MPLPVCLSGQLTCNSINIHNRNNNNNNYDSGCYLEPSADTHIFGGSRSPFYTAPRPFIVCIVCFCLLCVSTVCLAATCSPQAKILVLTNTLPPLSSSLCRSPSAFHVQLQSEMTFYDNEYIHCVLCAPDSLANYSHL